MGSEEYQSEPVILYRDELYYRPGNFAWLHRHRRLAMILCMALSDLFCLVVSLEISMRLWRLVRIDFLIENYHAVLPAVFFGLALIYTALSLYPGTGLGGVEELRRVTIGTAVLFLLLIFLTFYLGATTNWSRAITGLTWIFMSLSIPIMRKIARRLALRLNFWGEPAVLIGARESVEKISADLLQNRLGGFWPVLSIAAQDIADVFPRFASRTVDTWGDPSLFRGLDNILIIPGKQHFKAAKSVLMDKTHAFRRILLIFDEERLGSLWFSNLHLFEYFGLEVRHQWSNPVHQVYKRLFDLLLILISLPLIIPFFLIVGLAIKLDSPGSVFYTQKRLGKNGKQIHIVKFRSMFSGADQALEGHILQNPELEKEWSENFKLKHDPRITRVGRILRYTSLDELPQIWNVIKGEMSLIGPRPIVEEEIPLYGKEYEILKHVTPGITGLWQISGRNDLPYSERVNLDLYYLQNWSIWLDFHIFIHTFLAVILSRGAY